MLASENTPRNVGMCQSRTLPICTECMYCTHCSVHLGISQPVISKLARVHLPDQPVRLGFAMGPILVMWLRITDYVSPRGGRSTVCTVATRTQLFACQRSTTFHPSDAHVTHPETDRRHRHHHVITWLWQTQANSTGVCPSPHFVMSVLVHDL